MPEAMRWKRNDFRTYYARMKIAIGAKEPFSLYPGDEFQFDGSVLKYNGIEVPMLSLRGGFEQNWFATTQEDAEQEALPTTRAAGRNIANATSINRDLSRVQRGGNRQMETDHTDEDTVLNVSDRAAARSADGRGGHITQAHNRRTGKANSAATAMPITMDEMSAQEGRDVGQVRIKANAGVVNVLSASGSRLANQLENTPRGFGKPDAVRRGLPNLVRTEGVEIKMNVGHMNSDIGVDPDDQEGVVVAKVRQTDKPRNTGDITVADTSNIRQQRANGPRGPVNTPMPKKPSKPLPVKVRIARAIDPSFPEDWSFEGRLAERVSAVKDYGPTPEFVQALYAAEGDQMRKAIEKNFKKYLT